MMIRIINEKRNARTIADLIYISITYQGRQYRDECQENDDGRDALRDDTILEDLQSRASHPLRYSL